MTRVLVLSDSHGSMDNIKKAITEAGPVDVIIHLGDLVSDIKKINCDIISSGKRIEYVRGNCDSYGDGEETRYLTIEDVRILMTHGHYYSVNSDLNILYYTALENNCDVALYGHTHIPDITYNGRIWLINPGSVTQPRGGAPATFCIMEIDGKKIYASNISL